MYAGRLSDHLYPLIWSKTTTQLLIWYIHRLFSRFIRHSLSSSRSLSHFSDCWRFDLAWYCSRDGIPTLRFVHNFILRFALHLWSVRRDFQNGEICETHWLRDTLNSMTQTNAGYATHASNIFMVFSLSVMAARCAHFQHILIKKQGTPIKLVIGLLALRTSCLP